ncbi:putative septin aspE [Colletotrichum tofieldiae]|uniref:Putative septin aspE n=1 Tax=Colletotrichum tofieldiae TaxID=708197 RepID=A0A166MC11_9PEZI|nr:putative septin aspE [Colletotrichum tofieldiae]GKT62373.1 putative septin aspE [Colletotrichum tofieldiae]GKT69580.1 putative septin aspE [Colletotrichum tofieldiae]
MSQPRRSSFGMLLRRSKSGDLGKGGKKAQAQRQQQERELERQRQAAVSRNPPKLPEFYKVNDQLSNSIPSDLRAEEGSIMSDHTIGTAYSTRPSMEPSRSVAGTIPPMPPIPANAYDPYARTESMTHRGRYSYASSAISTVNSPRRVRRRKDPTPFNILVIGTRGAGKTSFLEFLKIALALPPKKRSRRTEAEEDTAPRSPPSGNFIPHYLETEIDGERVGLTLWDSEGLEKNVVDLQLREMSAFLESKFEETFTEEMKVIRSPGVQDTHIHAVFMVLDPARLDRNLASVRGGMSNGHNGKHAPPARIQGGLDEDLDLQVLRTLYGKTTVIPVISKSDTITTKHMNVLKKTVWETIKKSGLDPLEALGLDEDDDSTKIDEEEEDLASEDERAGSHDGEPFPFQGREGVPSSPGSNRLSSSSIRQYKAKQEAKADEVPFLPLSVISPDLYEPEVLGRQFPWGFADPYNEEHCDFTRLKDAVFSEWRAELREASREQWYEGWRTSRLKNSPNVRRR